MTDRINQEVAALAAFSEYFVKNYPGPRTIICDPTWHAPRIFRAALYALEQAGLLTTPDEPPVLSEAAVKALEAAMGMDGVPIMRIMSSDGAVLAETSMPGRAYEVPNDTDISTTEVTTMSHTQLSEARDAGKALQDICHSRAKRAGWWSCPKTGEPSTEEYIKASLLPQKLLLIHSEISEACEADRKGLMDSHLPHRSGVEVELADAVIRIMDLAGALNLDIGGAIAEKMEYNARRQDHTAAARASEHGKRY